MNERRRTSSFAEEKKRKRNPFMFSLTFFSTEMLFGSRKVLNFHLKEVFDDEKEDQEKNDDDDAVLLPDELQSLYVQYKRHLEDSTSKKEPFGKLESGTNVPSWAIFFLPFLSPRDNFVPNIPPPPVLAATDAISTVLYHFGYRRSKIHDRVAFRFFAQKRREEERELQKGKGKDVGGCGHSKTGERGFLFPFFPPSPPPTHSKGTYSARPSE